MGMNYFAALKASYNYIIFNSQPPNKTLTQPGTPICQTEKV